MTTRPRLSVALTIAGSDSGGGAGIQADLNTFAALGVHGTTAITCLTAQNPKGVFGIQAASPILVRQQIEAVFAELAPSACKTGMLYSRPLIDVVTDWFRRPGRPPLVVDPVMVATSGSLLFKRNALRALCNDLLPLASLVTPNVDEARLLTGLALRHPEDLRSAARQIYEKFGCAVLVKGGHLRGLKEAIDIFYDGRDELLLSASFVRGVSTHGTGCTYSAAITAHLAKGRSLNTAVQLAKDFITAAIKGSQMAGERHQILNWQLAGRR